jgi:hypothetical protein
VLQNEATNNLEATQAVRKASFFGSFKKKINKIFSTEAENSNKMIVTGKISIMGKEILNDKISA